MGSYLAPAAAIGVAVRHIFAILAVVLAAGAVARAESPSVDHAIAMHGEPALAKGFAHLPYADPAAPKGGRT